MDPRFSFLSVDVELSNRCDVGCRMCARARLVRERGSMGRSTFSNIARALSPLGSRITLCGLGNPVSNPLWSEFVSEYKKAGGTIGLVIHASHLSKQVREDLCRVEPNFVEISFPSAEEKHFRTLCPQSHYQKAKNAVLSLADAARGRFPLVLIGIRTGINPDEDTVFKKQWQSIGVQTRVFPCHSRGGSLSDSDLLASPLKIPPFSKCGLIGMHSFISWQGKLLACCHDLSGETEIGNFNQEGLQILLDRKTKLLDRPNPFSICDACDDPYRLIERPEGPFPESKRTRQKLFRRIGKKSS